MQARPLITSQGIGFYHSRPKIWECSLQLKRGERRSTPDRSPPPAEERKWSSFPSATEYRTSGLRFVPIRYFAEYVGMDIVPPKLQVSHIRLTSQSKISYSPKQQAPICLLEPATSKITLNNILYHYSSKFLLHLRRLLTFFWCLISSMQFHRIWAQLILNE